MVEITKVTNTDKCTVTKNMIITVGDYTKVIRDTQDCSWGISNNTNIANFIDKGMEGYECGIQAIGKGSCLLYSIDKKTQVRENINITVI